jgi:hypothetical protein
MPASKYEFNKPVSHDHEIWGINGAGKIGELRIKPSSILWKSKGQQKYKSIPLDDFIAWIEKEGNPVKQ